MGGPLADSARLSLAWFLLAGVGALAAATLTARYSGELLAHHSAPAVLGITHAWVIGFLMSATFGAVYQLLPVVVGVPLVRERLAWWHLGLHAVAVFGLIPSFLLGRYEGVAVMGILAGIGALFYALNVTRTVLRAPKKEIVAWSFVFSALWLIATVALGAVLAVNRRWGLWEGDPLPWLRAHAHLGVIGFFLSLIQGAAFKLVPMFTLALVPSWGRVKTGIVCSQAGLVGLAPSLAFGSGAGTGVFALLLAAGVVVSGWELRRTLAARRKKVLDHGLTGFVAGAIGFGGATLIGLVLALGPDIDAEWATHGAVLLGVLALIGGMVPMVSGMLCKIVPFLVWMRAYGPLVGRQLVPLAAQLPREVLERVWIEVHGVAILLFLLGLARGEAWWLWCAGLALLVATGSLWLNFLLVARHLWRPSRGVGFR